MTPVNQGTLNDRGGIFLKTWTKRCHKFIFFADDPGKLLLIPKKKISKN